MKINRNNYEIFFLDYHEGNLTPAMVEELLIFVENNPDLKEEFENFEEITIPIDESIKFDLKKSLKKTSFINTKNINEENYEKFFIAYFENDLAENEKTELLDFINKNPLLKKEFELTGKIHLKTDETIIYDSKSSIKKYPFFSRKAIYYSVGIAASLLILFGIYFLLTPEQNTGKYAVNIPSKLPINSKNIQIENAAQAFPEKLAFINNFSSFINEYQHMEYPKSNLTRIPQLNQTNIVHEVFAFTEFDTPTIILPHYQYKSLYEDIKIAENIQYASSNNFDLANKTLPGKIIAYAFNSIKNIFRRNVDPVIENSTNNPALWSIAQAGISGYNYLTDNEVKLQKKYDESGKLIAYSFESDDIQFQRKVRRK
ncbi:MAG: hypothetical protein K8R41_03365 [Bacteroidales bacterium]|nr:hypothetical protein [Bacteroidales bacterium]